eukprot:3502086-Rhodomonas_salina.1
MHTREPFCDAFCDEPLCDEPFVPSKRVCRDGAALLRLDLFVCLEEEHGVSSATACAVEPELVSLFVDERLDERLGVHRETQICHIVWKP